MKHIGHGLLPHACNTKEISGHAVREGYKLDATFSSFFVHAADQPAFWYLLMGLLWRH